jgi:hypothetical protein
MAQRKHILVVDGELQYQRLYKDFLDGLGHLSETTNDGLEALEKLESGFDLVQLERAEISLYVNSQFIAENMRLIYQTSKRSELNLVEHVWDELREKHLPNKAFRSLDAVELALCEGLLHL